MFGSVSGKGWSIEHTTQSTRFKFNPMDAVAITSDTLNMGLPVGHKGYILMANPAPGTAFDYAVRIPGTQQNLAIPECDLVAWDEYLDNEIHGAIREHWINEALDSGDESLFRELTRLNGTDEEDCS